MQVKVALYTIVASGAAKHTFDGDTREQPERYVRVSGNSCARGNFTCGEIGINTEEKHMKDSVCGHKLGDNPINLSNYCVFHCNFK